MRGKNKLTTQTRIQEIHVPLRGFPPKRRPGAPPKRPLNEFSDFHQTRPGGVQAALKQDYIMRADRKKHESSDFHQTRPGGPQQVLDRITGFENYLTAGLKTTHASSRPGGPEGAGGYTYTCR